MDNADDERGYESGLMRRMAADDAAAFDALFLRHRRAVFGFLLRMADGDAQAAEDRTQETFLRLWRARASYAPGAATVRTYLLTIARNIARDHYKHALREISAELLPTDDTLLSPTARARLCAEGPERLALAREAAGVLETALAALPPDLRETTLLREIERLSYEEIATILDCPIGTVRSRLSSARIRLRAALQIYLEEKPFV